MTQAPGAGSPASFSIHYTNIHGLSSNFASVEHHIAASLPNILLLSETQVSGDASTAPFQIFHYNLISRFRLKGGVCAYFNTNTPVARMMTLESPNFDAIWLRICLPTTTVILCFCYCPYSLWLAQLVALGTRIARIRGSCLRQGANNVR